jgi:hypothetical protein
MSNFDIQSLKIINSGNIASLYPNFAISDEGRIYDQQLLNYFKIQNYNAKNNHLYRDLVLPQEQCHIY